MSRRITISNTYKPKPPICDLCRTPNSFVDNGTTWKCQVCEYTINKNLNNKTEREPTHFSVITALVVFGVVCLVGFGVFYGWFSNSVKNASTLPTSAQTGNTQQPSFTLPPTAMPSASPLMELTPEPSPPTVPPTAPPTHEPFTGYRSANYAGGYYDGYWVNDLPNGYGTFTWPDGDVYAGNFVNGDFNGNGKITWSDGSWYEGEWENDERTGSGLYVQASGELLYNNSKYPWFYGSSTGLLHVEIEISVPCNVLLMDEENFLKYLNAQEYSYYGGDYDDGTVAINVQGEQRFYLSVTSDIGGTYSYHYFRDNKAVIPSSGEVSFNDHDYPWFYGSSTGVLNVEVDISVPCTVVLLDEVNFINYLNGQQYSYYGGDFDTGTVTINVQGEQRFYLSVTSKVSSTYSYSCHRY